MDYQEYANLQSLALHAEQLKIGTHYLKIRKTKNYITALTVEVKNINRNSWNNIETITVEYLDGSRKGDISDDRVDKQGKIMYGKVIYVEAL